MRLLRLFPRSWRERYGEEFEALLEESTLSPRDLIDVLHGVWDARVRPQPHLDMGGHAMSASVRQRLWSVPAALAALVLLVVVQAQALSIGPSVGSSPLVDWPDTGLAALSAGLGLAAAALWRWGRLRALWVFLVLLAIRLLQVSLSDPFLKWIDGALAPLYWQIDPLGLGWLPVALFMLATGTGLVVALSRLLRLRPLTAIIVGLCLELLIGPSDLALLRYLTLNGLEQAVLFLSPVPDTAGGLVGALAGPFPYLQLVALVLWAVVLQQIALRPADGGARPPVVRAYLTFARAHWAPLAALAVVVGLTRFALPGYLTSSAVQNPAHFTPTGTDVQAQVLACLKAYGVDLPAGASTKTASIPNGLAQRCSYVINSFPTQARGRPLPVPPPVTAGGVTYTVTSVQVAGNLLRIDWRASGRTVEEFGAAAYPAQPPPASRSASNQFGLFSARYLVSVVYDGAGNRAQPLGGGGELPRTTPYAWREQTSVLIPGPGQYTLDLGCSGPATPYAACGGAPNASITIVVS